MYEKMTRDYEGKTFIVNYVAGIQYPATLEDLHALAWKIASGFESEEPEGNFRVLGTHIECRLADGTVVLAARPVKETEVDAPYTHPNASWQCWPERQKKGFNPYRTWYVRCPEGHVWTFKVAYIRHDEE